MKVLLGLLLLAHINASAQPKIKKVMIDGNGAPLVLLPGAVANMASLSALTKTLSGQFKVIRMEHFNIEYETQGLLLPKNHSVRMESEAIRYTLDSLGIKDPVILVGSSYGGLLALDFAVNHPRRVRSLILLEPPFFGLLIAKKKSPEGLEKTIAVTKELTPQADITEEHVERFRCLQVNCDSISIRQLPQWKNWVQRKNILRGLSAAVSYKPARKKLKKFNKPVLIVTGTQTNAIHKRINTLLSAELRDSKEIFIESGHSIANTAPEQLAKAITDFVKVVY